MTERTKLIIGNWKMNPKTSKEALQLFKEISVAQKKVRKIYVGICAPTIYLSELSKIKGKSTKFLLGAQNMFYEESGAYTGEVGALQLKNIGIDIVLIGHSERRALGETDVDLNKKVKSALKRAITPIICIGENMRDGSVWYLSTIKTQLENVFDGIPKSALKNIVIAYEPVWAIGKDAVREATPEESLEMSIFIKRTLSHMYDEKSAHAMKILFGGSVNTQNAESYLRHGGIDGFLVGRDSLVLKSFAKILTIADTL